MVPLLIQASEPPHARPNIVILVVLVTPRPLSAMTGAGMSAAVVLPIVHQILLLLVI